jgi:hypothetical protein
LGYVSNIMTWQFQDNQYDDKVNNVCAKFKYTNTEVRTIGFTGTSVRDLHMAFKLPYV